MSILTEDTVWRSGQTIDLNGTLQIAPGATLTIEDGVTVNGGTIQTYGVLDVLGTAASNVTFNNVTFWFGRSPQTPGLIELAHAVINGGSFLNATGYGSYGTFHVSDSVFNETQGFYLWYPLDGSGFWRTEFNQTSLSVGTSEGFFVIDSAFDNASITAWASYGPAIVLSGNTFSNTGLRVDYGATVDARGNFWGELTSNGIAGRIWDANDDLTQGSQVNFSDWLTAPSLTAPVIGLSIRGSAGNDQIAGSIMSDRLYGVAGDDRLLGSAGNDWLDGGTGNDTMIGGLGNDTYRVDSADDLVSENADAGNDTVQSTITYRLGENVENLTLLGSSALNGTGNALANQINGNAGNNRLNGLADKDTLNGGAGNDTLDGGAGADRMTGGGGNDIYLVDAAGDLVVEGTRQGSDLVRSSISHTLADNVENLTLLGTSALNGTGNALANQIRGSAGNNQLNGLEGKDTINGGADNDTLNGGAGNDFLSGGAGNDHLIGGAGADGMTGGTGADVFVFIGLSDSTTRIAGRDTIFGFSRAQNDKIDLSAIDADTGRAANQAFKYLGDASFTGHAGELSARVVTGGTLIAGDVNGDRIADFAILLDNRLTLGADSFLL